MRFLLLFMLLLSTQVSAVESVTFEFVHIDLQANKHLTYVASTTDPEVIRAARKELKMPLKDRTLHIHGVLLKGQDNNAPWSWHFEANTWGLSIISAEFCDGNPRLVEENLDDWVKLGVYCPYSARVSKELN